MPNSQLLNSDLIYSATFVIGLALGSLAVLSTLFVFVRRSKFGLDGMVLTCFGSLLISLSLWQSVNIKVAGAEMKLERIKQTVEAAKPALAENPAIREKMEEWTREAEQGKTPTTVSAEELQVLINSWKTTVDLTANLSKDINDMAMTSVRKLR